LSCIGTSRRSRLVAARDVPTPLLCRSSMISRMTLCSASPRRCRTLRADSRSALAGSRAPADDVEHGFAEGSRQLLRIERSDAADHARAEIFSIPSTVVGPVASRNEALNWAPWMRSFIQDPLAWTNSPAEIIAAWPRTVIRSHCPRALTRRTQEPFSELWKVARSTRPAKTSVGVPVLGVATWSP
jgi:hypothetical protein